MMAQWRACKNQAHDAILLFRLGDFYEAFEEDAKILAQELSLTLTKRQEVPMSGIPYHTAEGYIDKLVAKGYRVAVAEQQESAKEAKGLVKRGIARIVTPGTLITSSLLSDKTNNFVAAIVPINATLGLAYLDITTADFHAMEFESEQALLDELSTLKPAELLTSEKTKAASPALFFELSKIGKVALHLQEAHRFDPEICQERLLRHFGLSQLDAFGLRGMTAAITAAGALLAYVSEDLSLATTHIRSIRPREQSGHMVLSLTTKRHLELVEPLREGQNRSTLLTHVDKTKTAMGGRLLRQWLTHPLLSPSEIGARQEAVVSLMPHTPLSTHFEEVRDLERLIMRIELGYASPRDLLSLRFSLEQIPPIARGLSSLNSHLVARNRAKLTDLSDIATLIAQSIFDTPPLRVSDGNVIKTGYNKELDELRALKGDHTQWIAAYQTELRATTEIKTLKVGYTKAFGYFIEVSRGQADKIPSHFERRQTLLGGERFITPELKEYEHKMLHAEEKMGALETELFHQVRLQVATRAAEIRSVAKAIAELDTLLALTLLAKQPGYIRPTIDEGSRLEIKGGRHPVVEALLPVHTFIANDVELNSEEAKLALITGPNMAGKSTYIRQAALLVILAQIGSFIPADSAHIGIIDKVFTRIGASDDLASGQSTFMVEMTETAEILNNATAKSLVILDEIGRGTSTYDGIAIAWSVAQYLHSKGIKTLFATHYFELTALEGELSGVVNLNVAACEQNGHIVFLHKIERGSADRSYGIHVAKLAGLPRSVIRRAQEIQMKLEKGKIKQPPSQQLELFGATSPLIEKLKAININTLTPLDAHRKIVEWLHEV
jgi:DNA mismatch repair protein MutS